MVVKATVKAETEQLETQISKIGNQNAKKHGLLRDPGQRSHEALDEHGPSARGQRLSYSAVVD